MIQVNKAHDHEVALQRAHDVAHQQNEQRRQRQAYSEHLKREAYDRAHPEVVAARKAAARAEAKRIELARQVQARKDVEAKRVANAQHAADAARQAKENHPCDTMWTYQKAGVSAYNNDSFQSAYDASISGLHYADECENDNAKTVAKGYLLVTKALSEKHLSSGDSEVDINQGITLLASCQGTPGLYATEIAARCEKEEDIAIRYKMQWEEDRYSSN